MEWTDVLNEAAAKFESLGINYIVVGSCASMIYGEIRFTQDVDILADVLSEHIAPLLASFPAPQHYVSQVAIEQALRQRSMFNIIYNEWAIKIDVMILDEPSRERDELGRAKTIARSNGA